MSENRQIQGVIVPIVTPVDGADRVDEASFRALIDHLSEAGVHGLFIGGSAGEGPLFPESEWRRMMEVAFDQANGKLTLLAGVNDTSTQKVLAKIRVVEEIGYKNFVLTPTFYIATRTASEHLRLFGACKEAAPELEMIAYNIPGVVASEIAVSTLIEMRNRGWISCCKESSGNIAYLSELLRQAQEVGLSVLCGDEAVIADSLMAGACGMVPVCANFEPQTYVDGFAAAREARYGDLLLMQQRVLKLRHEVVFTADCWLAVCKYAVSRLGIGSGKPVSPLEPLSEEQRRVVDRVLATS